MRKIFALLPAVLFVSFFVYLTVMIREFIPILFILAASYTASSVFLCLERHIPALIFGLLPAAYIAYEGLTASGPAYSVGTLFMWIAEGIVLFYICYYTSFFVYHRELNRK